MWKALTVLVVVVQPAPVPWWLYTLCYRRCCERAMSSLCSAGHWEALVLTEYRWWPWGMSVDSNPVVRRSSSTSPIPGMLGSRGQWGARDSSPSEAEILLQPTELQQVCSPPLLAQLEQHKKAVVQTGGPCTCAAASGTCMQALCPNRARCDVLKLFSFILTPRENESHGVPPGFWSASVSLAVSFVLYKKRIWCNGLTKYDEKQNWKRNKAFVWNILQATGAFNRFSEAGK